MSNEEYQAKVIELLQQILERLESVDCAVDRVKDTLDGGITVYEPR